MRQQKNQKELIFVYQKEIVDAILKVLKTHDRTHAVMVCGTGKTRVCLGVAEGLQAKRVAVFFPSIALINQLLNEWLPVTKWNTVSCLAIC